jgi:hypothetical protein
MNSSSGLQKSFLLAGAACLAFGWAGLVSSAWGQNKRVDIKTLKATDQPLVSFAKAIQAMKALPATDPHNWTFQANLHGFPSTPCPDPLWGQCQHAQWWFFPWHRAYLYYFEKIVQKYSCDPTFAIPYWNWTDATERTLPATFRDKCSQFYDSTRDAGVNDGTSSVMVSWVVDDFNAAMATTVFATNTDDPRKSFGGLIVATPQHFGTGFGALELSPHNRIHNWFGDGSNMSQVNLAARDPAFWLHHAMIDKTWVDWLAQGGGRANPTDDAWLNQTFSFYDENKKKVSIAVKDLLDTKALGYVYNHPSEKSDGKGGSKPVEKKAVPIASLTFKEPLELRTEPVTFNLKLPQPAQGKLTKLLLMRPRLSPSDIALRLDGVTYSPGHGDSSIVAYLNLPKDFKLKKGYNPDAENPYYADMFSPFGPFKDAPVWLHITRALQRARKMESWNPSELKITLVRHWFRSGGPPREIKTRLTIKGVTLLVSE